MTCDKQDYMEGPVETDLLHVFTDIETDSFKAIQLLQIAAVTEDGRQFNGYITPYRPLPLSVSNLLGIYYYKNSLYRNGLRIPSKHLIEVLTDFMKWIDSFQVPIMLVFHNGFNFDCTVLTRNLLHFNIKIPSNLIKVGDTLPFFRSVLQSPVVENHKLATLAKHYGIQQMHAHDALSDSETLRQICERYTQSNNTQLKVIFINCTRLFQEYVDKVSQGTPLVKLKKIAKAVPNE